MCLEEQHFAIEQNWRASIWRNLRREDLPAHDFEVSRGVEQAIWLSLQFLYQANYIDKLRGDGFVVSGQQLDPLVPTAGGPIVTPEPWEYLCQRTTLSFLLVHSFTSPSMWLKSPCQR